MNEEPDSIDLSIVVPCYNEQDNVRELVRRSNRSLLEADVTRFEILLVDDASRDRTWERIQELAGEFPEVIPIRHPENRGIVNGWRSGLLRSRGRIVLTTDADLQYAPEDIPLLYRTCLDGGWDLVQGWRKHHEEKNRMRDVLSAGFSVILRVLFSMPLHDVKSGFIAYRRNVLEDILDHRFRYFAFQSLPTVAAQFKRYRITQVPITFHKRFAGESFIKRPIIFSIRAAMDLPKALVEYRLLKPRPGRGRPAGQAGGNCTEGP